MFQQFRTSKGKFIAVKVPDDAEDCFIEYNEIQFISKISEKQFVMFPHANYELIGSAADLSPDQLVLYGLSEIKLILSPSERWLLIIKTKI